MIDKIFDQVKAGRGLWLGLFPEHSEHLSENRMRILGGIPDRPEEMPDYEDLHITLVHLGKNLSLKAVEGAHAAMEVAASMQTGELILYMTGVLRLRRHLAIALIPDAVVNLRAILRMAMKDRQVSVNDKFGMIPHMTIAKLRDGSDSPRIPFINESPLCFRGLRMVCGDAFCTIPFTEGPF